MKKNVQNLIIGAGLSGASIANLIANELKEKVLVIDKKDHIAGNSFDYRDKNGICIHKYGSHIFHTSDEKVWEFVNKFARFNNYKHVVLADINGVLVPLPFNLNSIHKLFDKNLAMKLESKLIKKYGLNSKISILEFKKDEDEDLKTLSKYVYENVFANYTKKQWGVNPETIGDKVVSRVPVFISREDGYFQDKYQGIPTNGYKEMVQNMLSHPNIEVKLNTDYESIKDEITYDKMFYTGSIDEFFGYKYGELPYRSVSFELKEYETEFYQPNSVINYPNDFDFTRVHEYKYYLNDKSDKTVIAKEFSTDFKIGENERFYPIENIKNLELYKKYSDESKKIDNVYFLGRLGDYKYYNMDCAIKRAIDLFEQIKIEKVN